jgi:arylsulfatase
MTDTSQEAKQSAVEADQNEKETKMSENPHVDGSSLPFPQIPSASVAGRTLAESDHHWRQDPKRLPEDAPNIVIFMSDDAGFSNPDTFGGPVHTPTLSKLAEGGIVYNRFHTTACVRRPGQPC